MILDFQAFREIQRAYEGSGVRSQEVKNLEKTGAAAAVEAVVIADYSNGIIYMTRDGGQTFEVEKTAERGSNAGISIRRILRISETKR